MIPVHAIKTCEGAYHYPREKIPVHIEEGAGRDVERVWMHWRRKNLILLPGFEHRTIQPVV
jgi:hypothetical protein